MCIAAMSPEDSSGWKDGLHHLESICSTNISSCIEEKTYSKSETLNDVIVGYSKRQSLLDQDSLVTEDFTLTAHGRYDTIHINQKIGQDYSLYQMFVSLFNSNYTIWIHDPHFFIINYNPFSLPTLTKGGV